VVQAAGEPSDEAAVVAAPWASGTLRLVPQVAAPFAWPSASVLTPAQP
jgi:hypothetical protein